MPIICLEGPSAVGKTTRAAALCDRIGAYRIPEVNELFDRPLDETETWYLERQIKRWSIARKQANQGCFVVLDGDPFQPLWYNWIAHHHSDTHSHFPEQPSLQSVYAFYREQIAEREIDFPDRYYLLLADKPELYRRKKSDSTRTRRNFAYHLAFAGPQRRYFEMLRERTPLSVTVLTAIDVEENVSEIVDDDSISIPSSSVKTLENVVRWLKRTDPFCPA